MHSQNNSQGLETNPVQELSFQELSQVTDLQNSGNLIETYIKGHSWSDSYNCITQLRKINKYNSEFIPAVLEQYNQIIVDLMNTGKPLLVKNILKLVKQLFDAGQQVNVEKAVHAFLPILIKKASTDMGSIKIIAQEVLTSFTSNCGYEISLVIAAEHCCDKNASIAELSVKLLGALIQKVGNKVMMLSENTLTTLMRALSAMVDGKRQTLCNSSLDICMFICESIGGENYMSLMNFCLSPQSVETMKNGMQTHRVDKLKPMRMKQAIKGRKTEMFNAEFFDKNNKPDYIPLQELPNNNTGYNNYNSYNNDYNSYNSVSYNNGSYY